MNTIDFNMRLVRLGRAIHQMQQTELSDEQQQVMITLDLLFWDVANGWIELSEPPTKEEETNA